VTDYTVSSLNEIDEISDGRVPWRPLRHHLGITSFGVNAFTGSKAGDRLINEHDEADEHEELYLVHQGRARFEIDGKEVDAPVGTLVYAKPGVKRTAFAEEPETTLIAIGGEPGQAYQAHGYEVWSQLQPLFQAGEYEQVADRGRELLKDHPEYAGVFYNVACAEALAGRGGDAIEHLRHAVGRSEQFRELAKEDEDFASIRDEPAFKELIGD
jgi:mannose-6-phosphate isomerase-like protein (cupin superfamily)